MTGDGCPSCSGKIQYTKEIFIKRAEEKYPGKFLYDKILDEDIVGYQSKPKVECVDCGFILFNTTVDTFINLYVECHRCRGTEKWTSERLKLACEKRAEEGVYSYENVDFSQEINNRTILPITCIPCKKDGFDSIFYQKIIKHFTSKHGCLRCAGHMSWNFERFKSDIPSIFLDYYDYSKVQPDMIKTSKSIIPIGCRICKNDFQREIGLHLIEMRGCTFCEKSEGEKMIYMLLKSWNILFIEQHPCIGPRGTTCRYDFMFSYNGKWVIIEFDGEQHFKCVPHWNKTKEDFEYSILKDVHKQFIALKAGCKMIRIDHTIKPKEIQKYLIEGLSSSESTYYSTPEKYLWLDEGVMNYKCDFIQQ